MNVSFSTTSRIALIAFVTTIAAQCGADEVELDGRIFTVADGLTVELVAGPPLVNRPISAAFDERGRLYVTDSSGSNDKVQVQLEKRPHRIVRLEDTDGDGRFDRNTVFADRMMFPEGAMWHDGSLYVAAPPQIWKLTDTNDDGTADRREVWFDGKTLNGCANDLHGPYLGPDGWIYWCKGAFEKQTYERPGTAPFVTRAAHIFRRRPEGGVIEPVMTGGMDNPVDVIFTPGGERIFTTTFLVHPAGGQRDGLIHAIYGGVYGKVHSVIDGHPRTGPLMPPLVHLGAAAPCGLLRLQHDALGKQYRNNVLAALFNMHKVTRHVLRPKGGTFETVDEDFLATADIDFHPTDVIEDADGSVLVVDTGGWYKLCCPTSQLWKPDILGAIYRVRRTSGHGEDDPRGRKIDFTALDAQKLTQLLGDSRPAVRNRASKELAGRGEEALSVLSGAVSAPQDAGVGRRAVWTLTKIDHARARTAVRAALGDQDETVRQAAIHSASVWRDAGAAEQLRKLLSGPSQQNRRAAAEALGRIGDRGAVPDLLAAASDAADRSVEHSVIYALIEIADADGTRRGLASNNAGTRRAVLVALDQMKDGNLTAANVVPLLSAKDKRLQDAAWWVAGQHRSDWGRELGVFLQSHVTSNATRLSADEFELLVSRVAPFCREASVQGALAAITYRRTATVAQRLAVLNVMSNSGHKIMLSVWSGALLHLLSSKEPELARAAVRMLRPFRDEKFVERAASRLAKMVQDPGRKAGLRLEALAVMPKGSIAIDDELMQVVTTRLSHSHSLAARALAVDAVSRAQLQKSQLQQLAAVLPAAGPLELERLIDVFVQSGDTGTGHLLVEALQKTPAASTLPRKELKAKLAKFGEAITRAAEPMFARLDEQAKGRFAKLEAMLDLLEDGDVRRGHRVFHSSKAACSACHAMGYLGGRTGPDLSRIGRIRTERDLLEAIVFPNASFVRSYEPVVITTKQGKTYSGIVRDESEKEILLAVDAEKIVRIATDEIEAREQGKVSIMPAGLEQQLTPQELVDLVTFLKAAQ